MHHKWGDNWKYWKLLNEGIRYIDNELGKARIGVHSKEKFGTARFSVFFFRGHLHELTHPGYVYSQYPKWLWEFDVMKSPYIFKYTGLTFVIRHLQYMWYRRTIINARALYPEIKEELLRDLDLTL